MNNLIYSCPPPRNEPVLGYKPNSEETKGLKEQMARLASMEVEVPLIINGKEVRTGKLTPMTSPQNHQRRLGSYHSAGPDEVKAAVDGALKARAGWAQVSPQSRAGVIAKAAELLSTKYRFVLNAATMLGQGKTCHQAEIDAACELVDFWRFNTFFQSQLLQMQPQSGPGMWNSLEYRPLEGFVFAVTPFNFTAIAGNLPTAPALMGNTVVWKPAGTAVYSGYFIMKILEEAGLPPGVIQFVPGSGAMMGGLLLADKNLSGVHFTGSTGVFQSMWKSVGENIANYRTYPRLVGETGGKDFVFVHESAEPDAVVAALVRGAFEYQGQKCSAASRAYIPRSLWAEIKEQLVAEVKSIKMGDVADFSNFMGAVIDKNSFENIKSYIDTAKRSSDAEILVGGGCDDRTGYFVEPTVIEAKNPSFKTMCEEIFGPVLTLYVYENNQLDETLRLVDETSPYALTGAIFARDRNVIDRLTAALVDSAGNFYINNKPTGAVVGQQPFGGARASGTNDKAGSLLNLIRWVSVRTVSETFVPPIDYRYPFLG